MKKEFSSRNPIVSVGMNQVSDINLAIAVELAGGISSLTTLLYSDDLQFDYLKLELDLERYLKFCDPVNLIISGPGSHFLDNDRRLLKILNKFGVSWCEIIDRISLESLREIKKYKINLLGKIIGLPADPAYIEIVDGFIFKGASGAGRIGLHISDSIETLTKKFIKLCEGKVLVPSGGISTPEEVKRLIDLGASAVGIGTLFAASTESLLSDSAKQQLVQAKQSSIEYLQTTDFSQSALVFSSVHETDKVNNTQGLIKGITTGTVGHLFVSKSVDKINSIRPVTEIIKDLVSLI